MTLTDSGGRRAEGWGETPLCVEWAWPSDVPYGDRLAAMQKLCVALTKAWLMHETAGHALEIGSSFMGGQLTDLLHSLNRERTGSEAMPWLAALVCCSAFDLALHDAYGNLLGRPVYETYHAEFMNHDLSAYLRPADGADVSFVGRYPADYFVFPRPQSLPAWHLVGGADRVTADEPERDEPDDGYPVAARLDSPRWSDVSEGETAGG